MHDKKRKFLIILKHFLSFLFAHAFTGQNTISCNLSFQIVGLLQAAKFNLAPGRSNQLQDVVVQELKTSER